MRYALIVGGVVRNIVEADQEWAGLLEVDAAVQTDTAGPGWLWDGQDFTRPASVPVVPDAVTMRQARRALHAAGLLAGVDAAIDALTEPDKTAARIEWEYSSEVQRHNGFVAQLAPALSLNEAQLDALFVAAAAL